MLSPPLLFNIYNVEKLKIHHDRSLLFNVKIINW